MVQELIDDLKQSQQRGNQYEIIFLENFIKNQIKQNNNINFNNKNYTVRKLTNHFQGSADFLIFSKIKKEEFFISVKKNLNNHLYNSSLENIANKLNFDLKKYNYKFQKQQQHFFNTNINLKQNDIKLIIKEKKKLYNKIIGYDFNNISENIRKLDLNLIKEMFNNNFDLTEFFLTILNLNETLSIIEYYSDSNIFKKIIPSKNEIRNKIKKTNISIDKIKNFNTGFNVSLNISITLKNGIIFNEILYIQFRYANYFLTKKLDFKIKSKENQKIFDLIYKIKNTNINNKNSLLFKKKFNIDYKNKILTFKNKNKLSYSFNKGGDNNKWLYIDISRNDYNLIIKDFKDFKLERNLIIEFKKDKKSPIIITKELKQIIEIKDYIYINNTKIKNGRSGGKEINLRLSLNDYKNKLIKKIIINKIIDKI
jgi:hypothetical protein